MHLYYPLILEATLQQQPLHPSYLAQPRQKHKYIPDKTNTFLQSLHYLYALLHCLVSYPWLICIRCVQFLLGPEHLLNFVESRLRYLECHCILVLNRPFTQLVPLDTLRLFSPSGSPVPS